LFGYSGVQHILCCIFVLFVFVLCLVCPMLPISLDCPFLIAPLVFSNIYSLLQGTIPPKDPSSDWYKLSFMCKDHDILHTRQRHPFTFHIKAKSGIWFCLHNLRTGLFVGWYPVAEDHDILHTWQRHPFTFHIKEIYTHRALISMPPFHLHMYCSINKKWYRCKFTWETFQLQYPIVKQHSPIITVF
jgi:hypothetical protein